MYRRRQRPAKRQKTIIDNVHDQEDDTTAVGVVQFAYEGKPKKTIPAGISHVTTSEAVEKIITECFRNCQTLRHLSIGRSVRAIDMGAFKGCANLTKVEFQEGLRCIRGQAFRKCTSLLEVDLPKTVTSIGMDAFEGCFSLKSARCHEQGSLDTIGDCAFMNCSSLADVTLPQKMDYIGAEVFKNCTSLTAVAVPKYDYIRPGTFRGCTSLFGVEIQQIDELRIEGSIFKGCTNLINVWVPNWKQGWDSFVGCEKMLINGKNRNERYENLVRRIRDRYTYLPVHKVCYYSSRATVEELMEVLGTDENASNAEYLQDCFGLTPFHVIATAANPRIDLFQCLVDHYPIEVLERKDTHGQMMMQYLLKHTSSHAMPFVKMVLQKLVMDKLNMRHLGQSKEAELLRRFESIQSDDDFETKCQRFDSFKKYARYCVMIEATSLIELALWKIQMSLMRKEDLETDYTIRKDCRCQCGADVVIGNVFGYLCKSRSDLFSHGNDERYSITAVC
ncbi:unnamed protein product [Cylindrotheca closterium]|uniref:Uncharacterized protein n=1 Tax=Cylindrotheca closterium TaxID=2856 RepID=A0AAD2FZB8_9STRA|nr:unnamed protein product [Cylindrotheca closterium]